MSERRVEALLRSPTADVFDVTCFAPEGAPSAVEHADVTQVVLPAGGVFEVHEGRDALIADPASAVILRAGREYRVGHPAGGGDRSTVLVFPPGIVEDSLTGGRRGGIVGPRVMLGARLLRSTLGGWIDEPLEGEELAVALFQRLSADLGPGDRVRPPAPYQRARVEQVRALLASRPGSRWRLDEIAREVHCSPFHLARQFRAVAGVSISTYLLRLRLGFALQRLAEGENDLASLAAELGFAHHSHFSARFRSVFGFPPGSARDALIGGRLGELRTFVTAADPAAS